MTAGKLAAVKPAATTNTFLYRCPIDKAASAVLNVVNQSGSTASYRVGLRDYDQTLTLDSSSYKLRKGNVVSAYTLTVTPGVQASSLTPGDLITLSNNNATFKYLDFVKPTSTINIPVKVETIGTASVSAVSGGSFAVGNTLTGTNGLTAEVFYYNSTNNTLQLKISNITNSSTSFRVSGDGTAVATSDLLNIDNELVTVTAKTGNSLTVTRASVGTTAAAHTAGASVKIVRPTASTTTLSAAITDIAATSIDVTSATAASLSVGDYILIGTEFLLITAIATNTLTVSRGTLGTTAATALNGATVTRHTDQGFVSLQYFANGETLDNGSGVTASASVGNASARVYNPATRFTYDINSTGSFSLPPSISLNVDRTYRFTQTDSSNTGEALGFKLSAEGAAYTTGVTTNGTAGSAGSYTQIVVSTTTPTSLFTAGTTSGIGTSISKDSNPLYTQIYIYDVEGTVVATDSFETGTGSNDVVTVTSGAYGYVYSYSGTSLKVSLGLNSVAFTSSVTFYDSPRTTADSRSIATVSSVTTATDINAEDYLFYGKSLSANTTDKNTSIVIGPGQSLVVYSSAADLNYSLNGFEDSTNDFDIYLYNRV
jgi:hypothetical protein